jgi:hypothetical protein
MAEALDGQGEPEVSEGNLGAATPSLDIAVPGFEDTAENSLYHADSTPQFQQRGSSGPSGAAQKPSSQEWWKVQRRQISSPFGAPSNPYSETRFERNGSILNDSVQRQLDQLLPALQKLKKKVQD